MKTVMYPFIYLPNSAFQKRKTKPSSPVPILFLDEVPRLRQFKNNSWTSHLPWLLGHYTLYSLLHALNFPFHKCSYSQFSSLATHILNIIMVLFHIMQDFTIKRICLQYDEHMIWFFHFYPGKIEHILPKKMPINATAGGALMSTHLDLHL